METICVAPRSISLLVAFVLLTFACLPAHAVDNMKAFPPAEAGMVRYVFQPPKQEDESKFKLELIVGKTVKTDKVNRHFFGGKIEEKTIEGWGFPKYVVSEIGPMVGTLMAVDPNEPPVERFITLGGEPFLIRYNSRLPVVVYVPEGVEVRYRIWRAQADTNTMEKG
jgi:ecotin